MELSEREKRSLENSRGKLTGLDKTIADLRRINNSIFEIATELQLSEYIVQCVWQRVVVEWSEEENKEK